MIELAKKILIIHGLIGHDLDGYKWKIHQAIFDFIKEDQRAHMTSPSRDGKWRLLGLPVETSLDDFGISLIKEGE